MSTVSKEIHGNSDKKRHHFKKILHGFRPFFRIEINLRVNALEKLIFISLKAQQPFRTHDKALFIILFLIALFKAGKFTCIY